MSKQQHNTFTADERPWDIGVFDSGVGGLSILKQLARHFPHARFHYIADRAYVPYGSLSSSEVAARAWWCTQELAIKRQCKLVVVACNTATAVAIESLRERLAKDARLSLLPIVGVEPYLNVLNKERERLGHVQQVVVLTTPLLANTERFQRLKEWRDSEARIQVYASPKLASLVEEWFDHAEEASAVFQLKQRIQEELAPLQAQSPQVVILGCTHYPLIRKHLETILRAECIDPSEQVAQRAQTLLAGHAFADSCTTSLSASFPAGQFAWLETRKDPSQNVWQWRPLASLDAWPK